MGLAHAWGDTVTAVCPLSYDRSGLHSSGSDRLVFVPLVSLDEASLQAFRGPAGGEREKNRWGQGCGRIAERGSGAAAGRVRGRDSKG